ncbi:MAG TPA: tetratricopeptide repeat protein [Candidatus Deferrimicrobiaceae bacterium]
MSDRIQRKYHFRLFSTVTILLVVAATLAVYGQVSGHGFLSYDDPLYVSSNAIVRDGLTPDGFRWAFTTGDVGNWHPLTWLSHMLDVSLFGMDPGRHHLSNVFIHIANTLLLLLLLYRMTGAFGRSAFVAALFALHPLHVESVAWISERKDVLSGFFFMLSLLAYERYCRRPEWKRMVPVVFLFALGLMAKPMLVTLPFLLLLLDYWPFRRMRCTPAGSADTEGSGGPLRPPAPLSALAIEKIPLFLLSAVSCVVTAVVQDRGGAVKSLEVIPWSARLLNIPVAYVRYLCKTFWPARLAVEYPHPGIAHSVGAAVAGLLLLAILTIFACRAARRYPSIFVGWFWFIGMLVPVIGLVQVGGQAMADRYTYLPLIGIFLLVAWPAWELAAPFRHRTALLGAAAVAVLALLTVTAYRQAGYWENSVTLYRHALEVNPRNPSILTNLGAEMGERGDYDEAVRLIREALLIEPERSDARFNLALFLERKGSMYEAAIEYQELLRRYPNDHEAAGNLERVLYRLRSGRERR